MWFGHSSALSSLIMHHFFICLIFLKWKSENFSINKWIMIVQDHQRGAVELLLASAFGFYVIIDIFCRAQEHNRSMKHWRRNWTLKKRNVLPPALNTQQCLFQWSKPVRKLHVVYTLCLSILLYLSLQQMSFPKSYYLFFFCRGWIPG